MNLKIRNKQLSENNRSYVYQTLKDNIMELRLKPGDAISEIEIGKLLNISRTPVRESFIKLAEDKLLDIFPQKGSYISLIDLALVREGMFMRNTLEKAVYKEAIHKLTGDLVNELKKIFAYQKALVSIPDHTSELYKLDNDFHELIFNGVHKKRIWDSIQVINTHYNRLRFLELKEGINIERVLSQHERLISMIENKNETGIEKLVDEHHNNIIEKLSYFVEAYPGFFTGQII